MTGDFCNETSPGFQDKQLLEHLSHYDGLNIQPEEARTFDPPLEAIKWNFDEERTLRLIFGNYPLSEFEEKQLQALQDFLKENHFPSDTCFEDRDYLLRFLQGNEWNVTKCYEDMQRHLDWQKETYPLPLDEIESSLKKGYCYVAGRDRYMRPIFIIRCVELQSCDHGEALQVVIYWLEFIIQRLLVRNRISQWNVILDLSNCSLTKFPVAVLKDVTVCLMRNFRGRLCRMTIINTPLIFLGLWKILKLLLPVSTRKKISILSSSYANELLSFIHPCQLEEYLGGNLQNHKDFSTPQLPGHPYY